MAKKEPAVVAPALIEDGAADGAGEIEVAAPQAAPDELAASGASDSAKPSTLIRALVLRDCGFGNAGEVVQLDEVSAESGREQGALDLAPSAVQSAER